MSTTVAKALALLDYFSEHEPEIGLSDLARRSGIDKATVHRMLAAMVTSGLVEQRSDSKLYRLGAGVLRLARVRETAFPITSILQGALEELTEKTGETTHASLISGLALATVGICESTRSNRVSLVAGELLPFHCTASGIATLAFAPAEFRTLALNSPMQAKTTQTITDVRKLKSIIATAEESGYAVADQTYEAEVYGIAVPLFDRSGEANGALAVATPTHRMTESLHSQIVAELFRATIKTSVELGGTIPPAYRKLASRYN